MFLAHFLKFVDCFFIFGLEVGDLIWQKCQYALLITSEQLVHTLQHRVEIRNLSIVLELGKAVPDRRNWLMLSFTVLKCCCLGDSAVGSSGNFELNSSRYRLKYSMDSFLSC